MLSMSFQAFINTKKQKQKKNVRCSQEFRWIQQQQQQTWLATCKNAVVERFSFVKWLKCSYTSFIVSFPIVPEHTNMNDEHEKKVKFLMHDWMWIYIQINRQSVAVAVAVQRKCTFRQVGDIFCWPLCVCVCIRFSEWNFR